jgi:uncharacterized membrane-anchored protein YitT (DUF2179 family)
LYTSRYVVLIILTGADLSEVLHIVLDIDPEDAIVGLFEVELLTEFFAPHVGVVGPSA